MQKDVDVKFDGDVITITMIEEKLNYLWHQWQFTYTGGYFEGTENEIRRGYWLHNLMKLMKHNTKFLLGNERTPVYIHDLTTDDLTSIKPNQSRNCGSADREARPDSHLSPNNDDCDTDGVTVGLENGSVKLMVNADLINKRWTEWKREQKRQYATESEEVRRRGYWLESLLVALETVLEFYLALTNLPKPLNQFSDFGPDDHPIGCVVGCKADLTVHENHTVPATGNKSTDCNMGAL